jgi:protein-S-isoprenylcysteine O-methyltransferase Ste14
MKNAGIITWTLSKVITSVPLVGWCALHLRRFDVGFAFALPAWTRLPGEVLLAAGALMVLTCGWILSTRGFGTHGDRFFPNEFVSLGPFRYVRNPMSLGAVTLTLGFALYHHSISLLLFSIFLFVLLHVIVVYIEEPGLEKRFGESYLRYKRSLNRWLPRLTAGAGESGATLTK